MAGNSQRRGAMRKEGTKKGATVGSGGQRRAKLDGRGPTPKATERPHHPAARRERAAKKRSESATKGAGGPRRSSRRSAGSVLMGRNPIVEALRAGIPATALYVQAKADADDRWRESMRIAVAKGIPIMEVAKTELDRMTEGGVHQGLVLVGAGVQVLRHPRSRERHAARRARRRHRPAQPGCDRPLGRGLRRRRHHRPDPPLGRRHGLRLEDLGRRAGPGAGRPGHEHDAHAPGRAEVRVHRHRPGGRRRRRPRRRSIARC